MASAGQEDFGNKVKSLTLDDVRGFFSYAGVTKHCPICGSKDFDPLLAQSQRQDRTGTEPVPGKPAIVTKPVHSDLQEGYEVRVPCIVLSCRNCGYTIEMTVGPMLVWKDGYDGEE